MAPLIGNVFSIAFGRNLDAHSGARPEGGIPVLNATVVRAALAGPESDASHQCLQGRECYASSIVMTTVACTVALLLALYAGWRDSRKARWQAMRGRSAPAEVVWDAGSD